GGGEVVPGDQVLAVVGEGKPARVLPHADLHHGLQRVQVDLEQPAVTPEVKCPARVGRVEDVAMRAVAGLDVTKQFVRVAVYHGDAARLALGDQHQVIDVATVRRRIGQVSHLNKHLAAGRHILKLPLDGGGARLGQNVVDQHVDLVFRQHR